MKQRTITIKASRELDKLGRMLANAGISYRTHYDMDLEIHRLYVFLSHGRRLSAICGRNTYGGDQGLLEIMGGLTKSEYSCDNVLGYLKARDVFKRFKYCYEHDTLRYRK